MLAPLLRFGKLCRMLLSSLRVFVRSKTVIFKRWMKNGFRANNTARVLLKAEVSLLLESGRICTFNTPRRILERLPDAR